LFLPHQNENIVIEFVTERMGGRRRKIGCHPHQGLIR
jgi:hypothetical protein